MGVYFSFRLQPRQIRRLGGPNLPGPALLVGFDSSSTGDRHIQSLLLTLPGAIVITTKSFGLEQFLEMRKRQGQWLFVSLKGSTVSSCWHRPPSTINVLPVMRDCLTSLAHGLHSASPHEGETLVSPAVPLQGSKWGYLPSRDCP